MAFKQVLRRNIQFAFGILTLVGVSACSSSGANPAVSDSSTTTTIPVKVTGEPVTDFNAVFKQQNAIDHSYLSIDKDGIYGVMVTDKFDFMQYFSNGWTSVTNNIVGVSSDSQGQRIDGVLVEKPLTVTTRDYVIDRENDFLIRFSSSNSVFGAIANVRNGLIELKHFCLTNPSLTRPGEIRVHAVENLQYDDQYKIIEATDYGAKGEPFKEYWRWSRKNKCFKITSSLR